MATKKVAVKEETAKGVAEKVADTKTDEVKTAKETPAAKAETVTETKTAETKKTAKKPAEKAPARKPGRKPAAEKKAAEKKETVKKVPAKKEEVKKEEVKESVHIQFGGRSYATEELVKIAKDVWQYDLNQAPEDFKTVDLYVKPEENIVYYVINGEVQGSFNI